VTRVRLSRAERRERTREELLAAAEALFTTRGFHATTVDEVAAEAGYTRGAVYSNFTSKEDLFFAVYERRAEQALAQVRTVLDQQEPAGGLERLAVDTTGRRGRDDGWLAVFFEFWAHVLRHPELRERFARIHQRAGEPFAAAVQQFADERGLALPMDAAQLALAWYAMLVGLALERLTQPQVVDAALGGRMQRLLWDILERGGDGPVDGRAP
jgi:AcrR family transcriptional regulator